MAGKCTSCGNPIDSADMSKPRPECGSWNREVVSTDTAVALEGEPTLTKLRRLTEQHRELVDEPLHLALSYEPATRDQGHIFLFEVVSSSGESVNPDRDLMEVAYASTPGFPMGPDEELHLILTYPSELKVALEQGWPLANELVDAIRAGDYAVVFQDEVGERTLGLLQAEALRPEAARG